MITVKRLRELISILPDETTLIAHQGEMGGGQVAGISFLYHGSYGYVETGFGHSDLIKDKNGQLIVIEKRIEREWQQMIDEGSKEYFIKGGTLERREKY